MLPSPPKGGRRSGLSRGGWALLLSSDKWLQCGSQSGRRSLVSQHPQHPQQRSHSSVTNFSDPNALCLQDILLFRRVQQGEQGSPNLGPTIWADAGFPVSTGSSDNGRHIRTQQSGGKCSEQRKVPKPSTLGDRAGPKGLTHSVCTHTFIYTSSTVSSPISEPTANRSPRFSGDLRATGTGLVTLPRT